MRRGRRLPRSFYGRDSLSVAPELLNKVLVLGERAGRITEVEAYRGADDPGSHAFRGVTPRTVTMFGPPGHLYVYFVYGMHWCANVVCGSEGMASAVLLRGLEPLRGVTVMRMSRGGNKPERDLCNGPAKLCQAMEIDGALDATDLVSASHGLTILDDGTAPPTAPGNGVRIGLSAGTEHPWRWWVEPS